MVSEKKSSIGASLDTAKRKLLFEGGPSQEVRVPLASEALGSSVSRPPVLLPTLLSGERRSVHILAGSEVL